MRLFRSFHFSRGKFRLVVEVKPSQIMYSSSDGWRLNRDGIWSFRSFSPTGNFVFCESLRAEKQDETCIWRFVSSSASMISNLGSSNEFRVECVWSLLEYILFRASLQSPQEYRHSISSLHHSDGPFDSTYVQSCELLWCLLVIIESRELSAWRVFWDASGLLTPFRFNKNSVQFSASNI